MITESQVRLWEGAFSALQHLHESLQSTLGEVHRCHCALAKIDRQAGGCGEHVQGLPQSPDILHVCSDKDDHVIVVLQNWAWAVGHGVEDAGVLSDEHLENAR